jgi:signal transduction histidine kinase
MMLLNAIKFTKGTITIAAKIEEGNTVKETGIGIINL